MSDLFSFIQESALAVGFDLCGITSDFTPRRQGYFLKWVEEKKYATMQWLSKNIDKRLAPNLLLDEAQSVLVLAVSYAHEPPKKDWKLARYAHGEDYHIWMKKMLEELAVVIRDKVGQHFFWKSFVDTGPVLERDLAAKSGLGWIGKNTCLIHEEKGSYLFLGVIFTNLKLASRQINPNLCATCRLCLDACPTQALTPYQLDAARCLAYQNIERRGKRDPEFWQALGDRMVGCDICQEVCPWNKSPAESKKIWRNGFKDFELGSLGDLLEMNETQYRKKTKHSAISRVKFYDFMRNAFIVIANTGRRDLLSSMRSWRECHQDTVPEEYQWCLEKLESES